MVERARGRGRSRKTWGQCVRDDMKLLGLHSEWAIFRDMWIVEGLDLGQTSYPSLAWKKGRFQNKWWWWINISCNEQCSEYIKVGDPKDNIRRDVRSIMQLLCTLYSNAKVFNYIVEGLKSKNAKQRTGQCHRECRCMYVQEFTSAKAAVRRNIFSSNRPFWI